MMTDKDYSLTRSSGKNLGSQSALVGNGRRRWGRAMMAVTALSLLVGPSWTVAPVFGAARDAIVLGDNGGGITATIRQDDTVVEQMKLSVGTSTVLDLNMPASRVEVSGPEIATVTVLSPKQLLLSGEKVGATQVILWSDNDERLVFGIVVEPNLAQLKGAIAQVVPDAIIDIRVVNEVVVLSGRVATVDDAERIVALASVVAPQIQNQMTVAGGQQVLLRCTVAEVSKLAVRKLGVDAWASFENNSPAGTVAQLAGVVPSAIGPTPGFGQGNTAFFGNTFLFGSNPEGFNFGVSSGGLQMEVFVRAMRENNLLRIMAEPNLVALSGEKAEFLAGGEFPVPVPQRDSVTIEWKDFGVKLEFIPTVIGQQRIRLSVQTRVSEVDFTLATQLQGFVVPGVSERRATTTIELASGSTIAIAGLLSEQIRGVVNKIPGLGQVPVLGALFRSVEYQRDLTELVILVTPELVSGMYPDQVQSVPGEMMKTVSDWELFGLGVIEGQPVDDQDPSRSDALQTDDAPRYRKFTSPPEQTSIHGPWGTANASETAK